METLLKYFPELSPRQKEQFEALRPLYEEWNRRINVISRRDMANFYLHHVLHSLSIARFIHFTPHSSVIDVGTGGGFPGIPLSIYFPQVHFTLLDSIGKKIKVVEAAAAALDLKNTTQIHSRSENHEGKYDFIVSRAVSALPQFVKLTRHLVAFKQRNAVPNGILSLKGGSLEDEIKPFGKKIMVFQISQWFGDPFFESKKLVHLPL